ncbi:MAG TPA: ABC transporter permease [Candidatus Woesebacteria bacterium]|nr:ABC transporter permease [Candidatus Woesebacteria bacterium]
MNISNTISIALKAIFINKVRSLLTMLGVIIGVSSVVLLISIGKGLENFITQQFEDLGTNNVYISPGQIFGEDGSFASSQRGAIQSMSLSFTIQDVRAIERLRPQIRAVTFYSPFTDTARFQDNNKDVTILGTSDNYNQVLITQLEKGRWFDEGESKGAEKVAVLGYDIYQDLFGESDAIGKKVRIGSISYEVVGVAEKKGTGGFSGPSFDEFIYLPFSTASRIYNDNKIMNIVVKIQNEDEVESSIALIEKTMLDNYEEDEFSVFDQRELLNVITDILGMVTIALGGIAAISLLVGGIGIMNIMLVSVTERTKEIGLRKALGATPNLILLQFLIEAASLSILGGLIGLGIAYGGSLALQSFFPAKVTWDAVVLAFSVSTVVGLIFGAAPARRASRLSPIEALRYE